MEVRQLRIDEIRAGFEVYAYCDERNEETIKQCQRFIDDLPPADVFNTEGGLILAGGCHRLEVI